MLMFFVLLFTDSAYEKGGGLGGLGERRGSVPIVSSTTSNEDTVMEPPSTPSRLAVSRGRIFSRMSMS